MIELIKVLILYNKTTDKLTIKLFITNGQIFPVLWVFDTLTVGFQLSIVCLDAKSDRKLDL
jgi:hypothetical protein